MFFTVGNLLTLGICILAILLVRYLDRSNRSVDLAREYGKRLMADVERFSEEKAAAVKDYGLELEVHRDAAKEVLNRLNITKEDLAEKAAAVAHIADRIAAYDKSLAELADMTGRVEENLGRLRGQFAFAAEADKKLGETRSKLEGLENGLKGLELRFERDNADSLEKTAESVIAAVRSAVSDLQSQAETIERQVEDHREAVDRAEQERKAALVRDVDLINKTLEEAVLRAGDRSGRLEEEILVKLRDEALARARRFEESWKADHAAAEQRQQEYRETQARQWERFERLADDASKLDVQLRLVMEEAEGRVRGDFARFSEEQKHSYETESHSLAAAMEAFRTELAGLGGELDVLKTRAYGNVSEKLKIFEDEFFTDITRRSGEVDARLEEWQSTLEAKLTGLAEEAEARRRVLEQSHSEELRLRLTEQSDRFLDDLERVKAEAGSFEEGIRAEMTAANQSLESARQQFRGDLEDLKVQARNDAQNEVARFALGMNETIKQNQRDLEEQLREAASGVEAWNEKFRNAEESSRRELETWQARFSSQLRDAEAALEEARRRSHDLLTETDDRISQVRSGIEEAHREALGHRNEMFTRVDEQIKALAGKIGEADRQIREFSVQTKLFEKADDLKHDLERSMEDLQGDLDVLDQRRKEAAQLKDQFDSIKRLEDEVSTRMTRFLSEKSRLEGMERDFNRLIQTSQSVEERLIHVTTADDVLQGVQIRIRKLEDEAREADEKFQRLERKNQVLDTVNDGIDRNFKTLEETEDTIRKLTGDIERSQDDLESFRPAIEKLAAASEKAREASDKLNALDTGLKTVEERIEAMQVAREWLARLETQLEETNKEAQEQVKLMGALLKDDGKIPKAGRGAPPIAARENVIRLARQGWTVDEIARGQKLSKSEVELILEMGSKG